LQFAEGERNGPVGHFEQLDASGFFVSPLSWPQENIMRAIILGLATTLFLTGAAFAQDQTPPPAAPAGDTSTAAPATPSDAVPAPATTAPAPVAQAAPAGPLPIDPSLPAMTGPQILIATSMGNITLQLDSVRAPKTVEHILTYVKAKHYDGTVFYRVMSEVLIQMGSWDARGQGRPDLIGIKRVPLETKNGLSNVRGSVGLARAEAPDSGGSDFFINIGDDSQLDAAKDVPGNTTGYAVFGKVISGMAVADAISKVKIGGVGPMEGQAPLKPILISKVSIVPGTDNSPAPAKPPAKKK
jgi:peptidyl-prolyl cis-trans isomerase A (cyclophilin A)